MFRHSYKLFWQDRPGNIHLDNDMYTENQASFSLYNLQYHWMALLYHRDYNQSSPHRLKMIFNSPVWLHSRWQVSQMWLHLLRHGNSPSLQRSPSQQHRQCEFIQKSGLHCFPYHAALSFWRCCNLQA